MGIEHRTVLTPTSSVALADLIATLAWEIDSKQDRIEDLIAENTSLKVELEGVTSRGNHA